MRLPATHTPPESPQHVGPGYTRPLELAPDQELEPPVSEPDAAPSLETVATRIVPVQELMRRRGGEQSVSSQSGQAPLLTPSAPRRSRRVWLVLLLACVAAVLGIVLSKSAPNWAAQLRGSASPPASAPRLPNTGTGLGTHAPERPPAQVEAPAERGKPRAAAPDQTAAIEALVSGDLARAVEIYDELAASQPHAPEYREAARILREKLRANADEP